MKKSLAGLFVAGALLAMMATGCTSKQLEELKAEVSSLQREISAKESEKASLQKAIADKEAQLAQCEKEKALAQERLKGM
jgi:septal ring factor EnvC (AmiA/AmiB activator)